MPAAPAHLEGLLSALTARGLRIRPDQVLRMHRLLELMPPGSCEDLRMTLGPVLASSEQEQALFQAVFQEVFCQAPPAPPAPPRRSTLKRQGLTWILIGVFVVLAAALCYWLNQRAVDLNPNGGKPTPIATTLSTTPAPSLPQPSLGPVRPNQPAPAKQPVASGSRMQLALLYGLPVLLLLLLLTWWIRRIRKRIASARASIQPRKANDQPPYVWPIVFDTQQEIPDFRTPLFQQAMRKLRRRQAVSGRRLDVARTTVATIRGAGYPTMVYLPASRAPEYLVLIDREGWNDHAAEYFTELTEAMEREGVYVERWYFENDARACQSGDGTERRLLADLARRFSDHRLLLFTSGAGMLNPLDGTLLPWTQILQTWTEGALLTPVPQEAWGGRETLLAGLAMLAPASVEGLDFVAEGWTEVSGRQAEEIARDPDAWDSWTEPLDLDRLRVRLGPVFPWAAACAMYPELHWPLTLRLGSLPEVGHDLVNEENLLRLARIPWFREGSIPAPWIEQLQEASDLTQQARLAIRTTLIELLEKEPDAPEFKGSAAEDSRRLEIAVSRALVDSLPRSEREQALQYVREQGAEDRLPKTEVTAQDGKLAFRTRWRPRKGWWGGLREANPAWGFAAAFRAKFETLLAARRRPKSAPREDPPPPRRKGEVLKVFVSATTADLRSVREIVKQGLLAMNALPIEQANFPPDRRSLTAMMEERIRECDAVIHLVGFRYGAEPDPATLSVGAARRSFTQMEADLASRLGRKLYIFLCSEDFPFDVCPPEPAELAALQRAYRAEISGRAATLYTRVGDRHEVALRVRELEPLREDLGEVMARRRRRLFGFVALCALVLGGVAYTIGKYDERRPGDVSDVIERGNYDATRIRANLIAQIQQRAREEIAKLDATRDWEKIAELEKTRDRQLADVDRFLEQIAGAFENKEATANYTTANRILAEHGVSEAVRFLDSKSVARDAKIVALEHAREVQQRAILELLREKLRAATLLEKDSQWDKAEAEYRAVVRDGGTWAEPRNALASLLIQRGGALDPAEGDPKLREAVDLCRGTLAAQPREAAPILWAETQNLLGLALVAQGGRAEGTESVRVLGEALSAYRAALEIYTRNASPQGWKDTRRNLAIALRALADRTQEAEATQLRAQAEAIDLELKVP